MISRDHVARIFRHLEENQAQRFYDHVSDQVEWTVMGTHPLAGTYCSKQEFLERVSRSLGTRLEDDRAMKVSHVHVDGTTAIVEMNLNAATRSGEPFYNTYCWVTEFDRHGKIAVVRAYLDSVAIERLMREGGGTPAAPGDKSSTNDNNHLGEATP